MTLNSTKSFYSSRDLSSTVSKRGWVLFVTLIGFVAVIMLSWLDEFLRIPEWVFGETPLQGNWEEGVIETTVVVVVAIPVLFLQFRLLQRLYYLESFLRICAWCKKINYEDNWVPLEEFFGKFSNTACSHGICKECARNLVDEAHRVSSKN